MSAKIGLDSDSFKALGSEVRIGILKELDKGQLTLTDLAEHLKMSKSSVSRHLDILLEAKLIEKNDERKWIYYNPTKKARRIMHPEKYPTMFYVLGTVAVIAMLVVFASLAPSLRMDDTGGLKAESDQYNLVVLKVLDAPYPNSSPSSDFLYEGVDEALSIDSSNETWEMQYNNTGGFFWKLQLVNLGKSYLPDLVTIYILAGDGETLLFNASASSVLNSTGSVQWYDSAEPYGKVGDRDLVYLDGLLAPSGSTVRIVSYDGMIADAHLMT